MIGAPIGVRFFFKQWGGVRKKRAGRQLHGRTCDEVPVAFSDRPVAQSELTL